MPELPEVETLVRDLGASGLVGRSIVKASVHWQRSLALPATPEFVRDIRGRKILNLSRRGKYIVLHLSEGFTLLVHLRMTGRFHLVASEAERDRYERIVLSLDDGRELRFRDTRKFGKWYLLKDAAAKLEKLGPEPLDAAFDNATFRQRLARHDRQLKPLLLDQSFLAGLGNIYVDEALWEAELHPETLSGRLKDKEAARLYQAIRKVLACGIRNLGTSLGQTHVHYYSVGGRRGRNQDALKVFRRTGEPCPRCHTPVERLIVGQRSSHICPRCQKKRGRKRKKTS